VRVNANEWWAAENMIIVNLAVHKAKLERMAASGNKFM